MTTKNLNNEIKLNLGCGGRPLPDYINIDLDTLNELKARYPIDNFPENIKVYQYDIFTLNSSRIKQFLLF